jgi:hypothetical protein
MYLRILQHLLVLIAWALYAQASELRLSTAQVEAQAPVDMSGHDTLTIYGEQNHDLLDLIDLSLASGTIRFESLDLANSGVISSTLSINAGTELVLDGVRTLNSNISISAAGGKVKVRNSVLGAINSPIAITHPASEVEIDNSAICRAQTGIRISAGQLTLNNTLFLTNTQALKIQGGQVLGLENLSFQGCEKGIRIENHDSLLTFTRCDFSGARDSLITNAMADTIQLVECYIKPTEAHKVFGPFNQTDSVNEPWRPEEKPLESAVVIGEEIIEIPLTVIPSDYTENGYPYTPCRFAVYRSSHPYSFLTLPAYTSETPNFLVSGLQSGSSFFRATTSIGDWIEE